MDNSTRFTLVLSLSLLALAASSAPSAAESLREYRPALPIRGPHSLVNLIDVQSLVKRGQGSATIFFNCVVDAIGEARGIVFYRGTPNSDMLGREVVRRCDQAQFSPAIYRHNPVAVLIQGTASLILQDGKPHLRIFLNQEDDDLTKGRDFIAPQFVLTSGLSKFRYFYPPPNSSGRSGIGAARLQMDATGRIAGSRVAYEYPAGAGFGAEVAGRITEAAFVPGFRDGKVTPCQFTWTLIFNRIGPEMPTG